MRTKALLVSATAKVLGGGKRDPSWADIEQQLSILFATDGFVELTLEDEKGLQKALQVTGSQHAFLLMLDDQTTDEVRSYRNPNGSNSRVEISGNYWTEWDICEDSKIAYQAFKEFFETGDVSKELLS